MKNYVINLSSSKKGFPHYWELCVGSCHAATALREDYRRQLTQCHHELGFKYVRFHDLFNDDMSVLLSGRNMLAAGQQNAAEYKLSFTNIDSIFDFLLSIGMKPFVELGFMPKALTSGNTSIFLYNGLTSPPDDYGKWQWFIEKFTAHCVERYGLDEVRQWFFEVWNEPDLGGPSTPMGFWGGTMEDYFKLYEAAAKGIKAVDHMLKVGGPATSNNKWIPEFRTFCRDNNVPLDFVSTHHYPTDDLVSLSINEMLPIFIKMEKGEELSEKEQKLAAEAMVEIGKSKDEQWKQVERGTLTRMARKAKAEAGDLPLYYTEWNSLAGLPSDGPFGASFIAKTIVDNAGLVEGYAYWTFSDIFEEGGMPSAEFHGGYGLMTLHGIPKASYRAYELLHKLGGEIYDDRFSEGNVDVYTIDKPQAGAIQILAVNHNSFSQDNFAEQVSVTIEGLSSFVKATVERIDNENGNAIASWKALGSPEYISEAERCTMLAASRTRVLPFDAEYENGSCKISLDIPEQGIALVTIYR